MDETQIRMLDDSNMVGAITEARLATFIEQYGELKPCTSVQGNHNSDQLVLVRHNDGSEKLFWTCLLSEHLRLIEADLGEPFYNEKMFCLYLHAFFLFAKTKEDAPAPVIVKWNGQIYIVAPWLDIEPPQDHHKKCPIFHEFLKRITNLFHETTAGLKITVEGIQNSMGFTLKYCPFCDEKLGRDE